MECAAGPQREKNQMSEQERLADRLIVSITPSMREQVERVAEQKQVCMSTVVRDWITAGLRRSAKRKAKTAK